MNDNQALYVYPLECTEFNDSIIIARGASRFVVQGEKASAFLKLIIALADDGIRMSALLDEFAKPDHEYVEQLVDALVERKFAIFSGARPSSKYNESPEDLFFWHFDSDRESYKFLQKDSLVVLVGLNVLSLNMRDALLRNGFEKVIFVDDPFLRDSEVFESSVIQELQSEIFSDDYLSDLKFSSGELKPLVVLCSDRGVSPASSNWNAWCLERAWPLLPVIFGNFRCAIGPLVIDKTTPCLDCLTARENANLNNPSLEYEWMHRAIDGRIADRVYLDAMILSVAGMATFEIIKTLAGITPPPIGEVIDYSLLETSIRRHPVLKIPRCPTCSSSVTRPAFNISRDEFRKKLIANGR